jgi:hypothetical protein
LDLGFSAGRFNTEFPELGSTAAASEYRHSYPLGERQCATAYPGMPEQSDRQRMIRHTLCIEATKSINKTRYSARLAMSGDKAPRIAEVLRRRGG